MQLKIGTMVVQLHTARRRANTPAFSSPARSVTASPLTVSSVGSVHHHYHSNDQLDNTANHWRPSLARRLSQGISITFYLYVLISKRINHSISLSNTLTQERNIDLFGNCLGNQITITIIANIFTSLSVLIVF